MLLNLIRRAITFVDWHPRVQNYRQYISYCQSLPQKVFPVTTYSPLKNKGIQNTLQKIFLSNIPTRRLVQKRFNYILQCLQAKQIIQNQHLNFIQPKLLKKMKESIQFCKDVNGKYQISGKGKAEIIQLSSIDVRGLFLHRQLNMPQKYYLLKQSKNSLDKFQFISNKKCSNQQLLNQLNLKKKMFDQRKYFNFYQIQFQDCEDLIKFKQVIYLVNSPKSVNFVSQQSKLGQTLASNQKFPNLVQAQFYFQGMDKAPNPVISDINFCLQGNLLL